MQKSSGETTARNRARSRRSFFYFDTLEAANVVTIELVFGERRISQNINITITQDCVCVWVCVCSAPVLRVRDRFDRWVFEFSFENEEWLFVDINEKSPRIEFESIFMRQTAAESLSRAIYVENYAIGLHETD